MHSSLLNTMTAFVDDCVILLSVTLPIKYCPLGVINDSISGKYTSIGSKVLLLTCKVRKETKSILRTFSNVYKHSTVVSLSPISLDTFCDNLTVNAFISTRKQKQNYK